jgi:hypothetical protein
MPRAVHLLAYAVCLVTVACGHEASIPSAATTTRAAVEAQPAPLQRLEAKVTPPAEPCVEVDTDRGGKHITLEGRIFVDDTYEHPTRGKTHPLILRLDTPRCAIGIDEPRVSELHLAASDGLTLKPLVGKHVRVSGDPFPAHTAWHARPIVLMTTTATTR